MDPAYAPYFDYDALSAAGSDSPDPLSTATPSTTSQLMDAEEAPTPPFDIKLHITTTSSHSQLPLTQPSPTQQDHVPVPASTPEGPISSEQQRAADYCNLDNAALSSNTRAGQP